MLVSVCVGVCVRACVWCVCVCLCVCLSVYLSVSSLCAFVCACLCVFHVSISVAHRGRQIGILEIDHLSSCWLVSFVHFESVFHIVCFGRVFVFVFVFVCNYIVIIICECATLELVGEHLVAIACVLACVS